MLLISMMAVALSGAEAAPVTETAQAAVTARPGRALYICARDEASRRDFRRKHGAVVFVSAREALADGQAWSAPRCITPKEYIRLEKLIEQR